MENANWRSALSVCLSDSGNLRIGITLEQLEWKKLQTSTLSQPIPSAEAPKKLSLNEAVRRS